MNSDLSLNFSMIVHNDRTESGWGTPRGKPTCSDASPCPLICRVPEAFAFLANVWVLSALLHSRIGINVSRANGPSSGPRGVSVIST
jgi:hypothetical protein